jgi:hypothetical protein
LKEQQVKNYQIEHNHGLIDAQGYYVQDVLGLTMQFPKQKRLNTIGDVMSHRQLKGNSSNLAYLYHRSSPQLNVAIYTS